MSIFVISASAAPTFALAPGYPEALSRTRIHLTNPSYRQFLRSGPSRGLARPEAHSP
jgi:hypothetical protein